MGATPGGIVHLIVMWCGNQEAVRFMGDVQRLMNRWLLSRGFSIGIADCVPAGACEAAIRGSIDDGMKRIDALQSEAPSWSSDLSGSTGDSHLEKMWIERTIHRLVSQIQMSTGNMLRSETPRSNALRTMVMAGSKGNNINICQITLCVGQNCVGGARLHPESASSRTLPRYAHGQACVDGMGFVSNSYVSGLRAGEAFFHAAGGREGLVDTAVKTSRTGYIQRRLIKGMESHRTEHDFSVRNDSNGIVEFTYGSDGMNPRFMERTLVRAYAMSPGALHDAVRHVAATPRDIAQEEAALMSLHAAVRSSWTHRLRCRNALFVSLPVNPTRMLSTIVPSERTSASATVSCSRVIDDLKYIDDELLRVLPEPATRCLRLTLRFELRTAHVVGRLRVSERAWTLLIECIYSRIQKSLVDAGEMVGTVAAQSIGEPATQMTLNTFHLGTPAPAFVVPPVPSVCAVCLVQLEWQSKA